MTERAIPPETVETIISTGEVIESYPDDSQLPSYLMLGYAESRAVHIVAADDQSVKKTYIITVYEPSRLEWESDFRKRRSLR